MMGQPAATPTAAQGGPVWRQRAHRAVEAFFFGVLALTGLSFTLGMWPFAWQLFMGLFTGTLAAYLQHRARAGLAGALHDRKWTALTTLEGLLGLIELTVLCAVQGNLVVWLAAPSLWLSPWTRLSRAAAAWLGAAWSAITLRRSIARAATWLAQRGLQAWSRTSRHAPLLPLWTAPQSAVGAKTAQSSGSVPAARADKKAKRPSMPPQVCCRFVLKPCLQLPADQAVQRRYLLPKSTRSAQHSLTWPSAAAQWQLLLQRRLHSGSQPSAGDD